MWILHAAVVRYERESRSVSHPIVIRQYEIPLFPYLINDLTNQLVIFVRFDSDKNCFNGLGLHTASIDSRRLNIGRGSPYAVTTVVCSISGVAVEDTRRRVANTSRRGQNLVRARISSYNDRERCGHCEVWGMLKWFYVGYSREGQFI